MTNREYAELLDYVNERSNELDSVNIYKVHSAYDPKTNEISKVTLKLNYTKDGTPLPEINGRLTKAMQRNIVARTEQFRGESCTKESVKDFIDTIMTTKEGQL